MVTALFCIIHKDLFSFLENVSNPLYDVIISFDILEHFTKQEVFILVDKIYQALKPDGKLLLHVSNGEVIFSGSVFWSDLTHETCFTKQSISQLIRLVGFKVAKFYEDVPIIQGVKSLFDRYFLLFILLKLAILVKVLFCQEIYLW